MAKCHGLCFCHCLVEESLPSLAVGVVAKLENKRRVLAPYGSDCAPQAAWLWWVRWVGHSASPACLESWPSSDSMRASVPGLPAVDAGRSLPLLAHGQGARTGEGESNHETSQRHPSSPASSSPSLSISPFSPSSPPRCVRGPLNLPSRSGCLARDISGTHLSESPALFSRRRAYHLSDRPFFRFSSHPLPLRRISSCPILFLLSSLLASDKSLSSIQRL